MRLSDFKKALKSAGNREIPVLQFHGVPDPVHPWVHTEPELFHECLEYLHENNYRVIAMRDLESLLPAVDPEDPLMKKRHVLGDTSAGLKWPREVLDSRAKKDYWIGIMQEFHYSVSEMAAVLGYSESEVDEVLSMHGSDEIQHESGRIRILPWPGGRHPRIGFREGMLSPMRGTKVGIFLPWNPDEYLVLDLPEAVSTQYGLTFLGHKHIPTVFDHRMKEIINRDWELHPDGHLTNHWELPNNLVIGAEIYPGKEEIDMSLWLYNGTSDTTFTGLQTQVCIMLGGASDYDGLTNENKSFEDPVVTVKSESGTPWIITAWENCTHAWGNADCPCMHSDPTLPDCGPGDTVRVTGKITFPQHEKIENEIKKYSILYSTR
jgi:hypothetical protein